MDNEMTMDNEKIITRDEIKRIIEAVLFAAGHPVTFEKLAEVIGVSEDEISDAVDEYIAEYDASGLVRGIQLLKLGRACQLTTKEVFIDYVKAALGVREGGNLSKASLETLAIIAYNQPVTKSFIEDVRGVDCSYIVGSLCEKRLVEERGRLDIPGRPLLYGTTDNFLRCFNLESLADLPKLPRLEGDDPDQMTIEEYTEQVAQQEAAEHADAEAVENADNAENAD